MFSEPFFFFFPGQCVCFFDHFIYLFFSFRAIPEHFCALYRSTLCRSLYHRLLDVARDGVYAKDVFGAYDRYNETGVVSTYVSFLPFIA